MEFNLPGVVVVKYAGQIRTNVLPVMRLPKEDVARILKNALETTSVLLWLFIWGHKGIPAPLLISVHQQIQ